MKNVTELKKYAAPNQRIAKHVPTGLYCAVISEGDDKCFCNFGAIANPFTNVKASELVTAEE